MSTHTLLWDGVRNRLEVTTVEEMLSRNRIAYTEDLAAFPVPLYIGSEAECRDGLAACSGTVALRAEQLQRRAEVLAQRQAPEVRPVRVLDEPVPVAAR